jgi:hypothetical protein
MGDKSEYGQEVYDLCWSLYVEQRMSGAKIAQYLFDNYGVVSETDHSKPMNRRTIYRWMDKAQGSVEKAQRRRKRIEPSVAAHDLDVARDLAYIALGDEEFSRYKAMSPMEQVAVIRGFLDMRAERSKTYDVYPDKRKQLTVTTESGGVPRKELEKKGEEWEITWSRMSAHRNGELASGESG